MTNGPQPKTLASRAAVDVRYLFTWHRANDPMVEHHIDFAKYDEDDLYAALQTVDEETYPHHALDLYRVLKSRAIDQETIAEKARTVSFGPLDEVFELLMAPLLTNHKLDGDGLGSKLARLQVLEEKMTN